MNIRWLALPAALLCCQIAAAQERPQTSQETHTAQVDIESATCKIARDGGASGTHSKTSSSASTTSSRHQAFDVHCGWKCCASFGFTSVAGVPGVGTTR